MGPTLVRGSPLVTASLLIPERVEEGFDGFLDSRRELRDRATEWFVDGGVSREDSSVPGPLTRMSVLPLVWIVPSGPGVCHKPLDAMLVADGPTVVVRVEDVVA